MRIPRKFQKLLSFDGVESLWEHVCRWTHSVSSRRIMATLDRSELSRLREQYPYRPDARRINMYEDAAHWIGVHVAHAQDLWLDRTPPLRILDLGCGAGYFLYVCRFFGHEALGLDTDEEPLFREAADDSRPLRSCTARGVSRLPGSDIALAATGRRGGSSSAVRHRHD